MAIVTFIIGLWIILRVVKLVGRGLQNKAVVATLRLFLITLTGFMLNVMLFIAVAGQIGIETISFILITIECFSGCYIFKLT